MIKVVCIKIDDNNPPYNNTLQIGKIYEARDYSELDLSDAGPSATSSNLFYILNLTKWPKIFPKSLFITLAEYREQQINNILDDVDENDMYF